jgi:hypothetical protein
VVGICTASQRGARLRVRVRVWVWVCVCVCVCAGAGVGVCVGAGVCAGVCAGVGAAMGVCGVGGDVDVPEDLPYISVAQVRERLACFEKAFRGGDPPSKLNTRLWLGFSGTYPAIQLRDSQVLILSFYRILLLSDRLLIIFYYSIYVFNVFSYCRQPGVDEG